MTAERRQERFFPVAVWYGEGKARAPMVLPSTEETRRLAQRDLENIRKLGFNSVRYWIDWARAEPEPGKWALEPLGFLLDLADKTGLKVILQLYLESAPSWIVSMYPDARFQAQSGDVIDPQSSPGVCLDHPDVRSRAERLMLKIAETVKDHPAFYAWDVWSEPHLVQWTWLDWLPRGAGWFCYCCHTQDRFRRWLKGRYGNIEALNEAWYRTYRSWEEVQPPKYVTLSSWCDLIDWQLFCMEKLAEDLRWRVQTIKKVDPHHLISSHSAISSVFTSPLSWYGNPDDWKMAEEVDVWGTSLYPKHVGSMMPLDPVQYGMAIDATRCASYSRGKTFWLGELQGGHGVTGLHFGEPVTPEDVRLWAWSAVARGAKGLCYYAWYPMSCGYENSGFGLINLDGSITDRARAAGAVGKTVNENMEVLLEAKPMPAEVAIVYNPLSYAMLTCSREHSVATPVQSMMGIYRALTERNIPVDFVHADDFLDGSIESYKLVFLPFSIMMTPKIAESIKRFVGRGGKLVAEFRPGWSDDTGRCSKAIPGLGLHELFGCQELFVWEEERPAISVVGSCTALGLHRGVELCGAYYAEALQVNSAGAKVIGEFSNGLAGIVLNKYGAGEVIFIGSLLGAAYEKFQDTNVGEFLKELVRWAGVSSTVEILSEESRKIEVRTLVGRTFNLLFVFNYDSKPICVELQTPVPLCDCYAYEITQNKVISSECKNGSFILKCELEPRDVQIIRIAKREGKEGSC